MDPTTQILIVIKQIGVEGSLLVLNEYENFHTLTTTTTGSKCSQKEANNQTDYQNHNALGPPEVPSFQALVSVEVKSKTHTQQSTSSSETA